MVDYGSSSRDRLEEQTESTSRLLESARYPHEITRKPPSKSSWSIVAASTFSIICLVFATAFLVSGKKTTDTARLNSNPLLSSTTFSLVASNEYGQYDGSSYPWMSEVEGTQLVEPHKQTLLTVVGTVHVEDYTYTWTIVNDNGLKATDDYVLIESMENMQSVRFLKTGIYSMKVKLLNSSGKTKYSYSTRLVCK
jgi:hypothetical protein